MNLLSVTFSSDERIVRIIYSEKNVNPRTNKLRDNFFRFSHNPETDKFELSCIRFEFESIAFCRLFGKENQDIEHGREYYGVGCINPSLIFELQHYELKFTPNTNSNPKNYFHTDIYDNLSAETIGQAMSAEDKFRLDEFRKRWLSYKDDDSLSDGDIMAFRNN